MRAAGLAVLTMMVASPMSAQVVDGPQPTFTVRSSTRQKLTTTTVELTFIPKTDLSQLDFKIHGTTAPLHNSETAGIDHETSLGSLKAGQKSQIAGTVVSAPGESGEIELSGRAVNAGFSVSEVQARVPYENEGGKLQVRSPSQAEGSTVAVSAEPVQALVSDGYVVEGDMRLVSKGFSGLDRGGDVKLSAEGVTLLDSKSPLTKSDREVIQSVRFAAADGQKGRIIAEIVSKNKNGQPFVRRAYLYVLATAAKIYTGTSGFTELEIQKLKDDRGAHRITDEQFEAAMTAVLSGATDAGGPK